MNSSMVQKILGIESLQYHHNEDTTNLVSDMVYYTNVAGMSEDVKYVTKSNVSACASLILY